MHWCWRSVAARHSAPAGCVRPARARSAWTSRPPSCDTPGRWTSGPGSWSPFSPPTHLPLRDASFDLACSAYGALPFVADAAAVHREVARVLRPGGRWVFSVTHPIRWCLPDDPGPGGLTVRDSYFDRRAYVECDADGRPSYVEHHRTLGDHVRQVVAAGLELLDLVEPEWPDGHERTWGGWSPLRGRLVPGTAIFVTRRPPAP
jgi:SAM-dependent methyltransferase